MNLPANARQGGFSLIELLIVVIILAILAAVAIPMFRGDTEDAKLVQLEANLKVLREAVELYYHQHNATYPGVKKNDGSGQILASAVQAALAFVEQMTLYTDVEGGTSPTKDGTHRFGPYLKGGIPKNPFNDKDGIVCDLSNDGFDNPVADGATGWKFYLKTGVLHANDEDHKSY